VVDSLHFLSFCFRVFLGKDNNHRWHETKTSRFYFLLDFLFRFLKLYVRCLILSHQIYLSFRRHLFLSPHEVTHKASEMIKTFQSNLKWISIISYAVKCLILNLFIYLITFPPCSIQIIQLMTRIFHLFHYEILFPLLIWHSDHPVDSTDSLSVKWNFIRAGVY